MIYLCSIENQMPFSLLVIVTYNHHKLSISILIKQTRRIGACPLTPQNFSRSKHKVGPIFGNLKEDVKGIRFPSPDFDFHVFQFKKLSPLLLFIFVFQDFVYEPPPPPIFKNDATSLLKQC